MGERSTATSADMAHTAAIRPASVARTGRERLAEDEDLQLVVAGEHAGALRRGERE